MASDGVTPDLQNYFQADGLHPNARWRRGCGGGYGPLCPSGVKPVRGRHERADHCPAGAGAQSPRRQARRVVAIAGPPASGKSTLAAGLVAAIRGAGVHSQLVPMDGFHLDNRILSDRGILDRKGSPPSFDAMDFSGWCKCSVHRRSYIIRFLIGPVISLLRARGILLLNVIQSSSKAITF